MLSVPYTFEHLFLGSSSIYWLLLPVEQSLYFNRMDQEVTRI